MITILIKWKAHKILYLDYSDALNLVDDGLRAGGLDSECFLETPAFKTNGNQHPTLKRTKCQSEKFDKENFFSSAV